MGGEWRNSKGAGSFGVGNSRQPSRKQIPESTNVNDSRISEESGKMSVDKFSAMDSPSAPSTSRALDVRPFAPQYCHSFNEEFPINSQNERGWEDLNSRTIVSLLGCI